MKLTSGIGKYVQKASYSKKSISLLYRGSIIKKPFSLYPTIRLKWPKNVDVTFFLGYQPKKTGIPFFINLFKGKINFFAFFIASFLFEKEKWYIKKVYNLYFLNL